MSIRLISCVLSALAASGCALALAEPPEPSGPGFWRLLDTREVGAAEFVKKHPTWDGRGAVIAVLDTGVDMRARGLEKTSEGKVKVIEARDFSGEGDIDLAVAKPKTVEGVSYLTDGSDLVRGFELLAEKPEDGTWRLGMLEEARFKNSEVSDVNRNGTGSDHFAVLAAKTKAGWVAYVDLDGDGDMGGEAPIRSYGEAQQSFTFRLRNPDTQRPPATFALHLADGGTRVELHFDDGGHGTHVAGMAAGFRLMGRDGFDGIAPGAEVMSLKIGDNTLSGGSTTTDSMRRAIEFAGEWSEEHHRPVVMNISYGIGSEIEGKSDIDQALDDALSKYPLLAASVSAGNEGPGLSSVGTPAASRLAVSVAAMLPRATAEALFGSRVDRNKVFTFSSRGGELAKPDVLAPGIASSSTPNFDGGDVKGGTSMAAPEITGVHALLMSAALGTKTRISGTTLKRAILQSARPLPGYLPVDQGAGVPDVERALKALTAMASRAEPFAVAGYRVETDVPTAEEGQGQAAYWRAGTYLPPRETGQSFTLAAMFPNAATSAARTDFHTLLTFDVEPKWLRIDRSTVRLMGERESRVTVTYDAAALSKPGVYSGRILATPDDGAGVPAFALWATVVSPYTFEASNRYALDVEDRGLEPGDFDRFPVLVPPGASRMIVTMAAAGDAYCDAVLWLYDPAGHAVAVDEMSASSERNLTAVANVGGKDLTPGIWEVVPLSGFQGKASSRYSLAVRFRGLDASPITTLQTAPGKAATAQLSITNRFDTRFSGSVEGELFGYRRTRTETIDGDTYEGTFHMNSDIERVDLVLRLTPKVYNRFTDVAVNVVDESGAAIAKDGFSTGVARVSVDNPSRTKASTYTLQIKGGLTKRSEAAWKVTIEETFVRASRNAVGAEGTVVLYPNVPASVRLTMTGTPPQAPSGYTNVGEVKLTDRKTDEMWLNVPIELH